MKDEIIDERIKENEKLFSKDELEFINSNDKLVKKIYLLGVIDSIKIFGKN